MPLFEEHDDAGRFRVDGAVVDGLRMDTKDVREAIVSIVNLLHSSNVRWLGDISVEIRSSVERTEKIVSHLASISLVSFLSGSELAAFTSNPFARIVKLDTATLNATLYG